MCLEQQAPFRAQHHLFPNHEKESQRFRLHELLPRVLLNISRPVATVSRVSQTDELEFIVKFDNARSTRPVATVPRPEMENTSSIGIRKGLSTSRIGVGIFSSTVFINCYDASIYFASPSRALRAEPRMIGQF